MRAAIAGAKAKARSVAEGAYMPMRPAAWAVEICPAITDRVGDIAKVSGANGIRERGCHFFSLSVWCNVLSECWSESAMKFW